MVTATEKHPTLAELIGYGRTVGYVTYEQINTLLPDELVDPEKIDELLVCLDAAGIRMVDFGPQPVVRLARHVVDAQEEPNAPATGN